MEIKKRKVEMEDGKEERERQENGNIKENVEMEEEKEEREKGRKWK